MIGMLFFLFIVLIPIQAFGKLSPPLVDSLYQQALSLPDSLPVETKIKAFESVIHADRKYAPAYHQLVYLYLMQNTISSRQRAETAIRNALRLEPDQEAYHLTLGEVLWAKGFRFNSSKQYQKMLESYPTSAHAAYWVGLRALKEYLKYQDMVDYDNLGCGSTVTVDWSHFANHDWDNAVSYFRMSIDADPDDADAYYQLGLAHFENGDPENLLAICQQLLARKPDDKNAYLFSGLAYQHLERQENAYLCYNRAMDQMSGEERAIMESVVYIAPFFSHDTHQPMLTAWTDEQARDRFWRRDDPLYLTTFNERILEHYGRVAYANLRFGRPAKRIAGWQTDMGRIYIRYGRWLNKTTQRPDIGVAHTETWFYETFSITFRNGDGFDGWFFDNSHNYVTGHKTASPKEFMQQNASRYVDPYRKQKYSVPNLVAAFREADSVRIEMAYALPKDKLDTVDDKGHADMNTGFFFYDEAWDAVQQYTENTVLIYPSNTPNNNWRVYALQQKTVYVPPGSYHLIGETINEGNKSIGTFRTHRTFAFPDSGLAMSDLLLAANIELKTPYPVSRNELKIQPNPLRAFNRVHPVFIYMEVYNLIRNAYGRTHFDIAYQLSVPDKSEIDPALFDAQNLPEGTLIITPQFDPNGVATYNVQYKLSERNRIAQTAPQVRQLDNRIETAVSAEYEGDRNNDFTFLEIDVNQLPIGIYALTVTVTDQQTETPVQKRTLFRIVE